MLQDISGQVAWVTGAGTGIGEAGALALAEQGCAVALSGRRAAPLEDLASRIEKTGGKVLVLPLDVADRDAVMAAGAQVVEQFGRVDTLINSAGLNVTERSWHNVSLDDWDQVIRVDLDGAFYCIKAVLPQMREQGSGLVINVSSWAGRYVSPVTGPAYSSAKHAMNAMNESLNQENCIYGIRAVAVCPGEVSTPILDSRPVKVTEQERAQMVQSEDMGELVRFLCQMPPHVCINELTISPTWNRGYVPMAKNLNQW